MQIILTPEICESLKIDTVALISLKNALSIKPVIIEEQFFFAITPTVEEYEQFTQLRILFRDAIEMYFPVSFLNIVENDGIKLVCFKIQYDNQTEFYRRLESFFSATSFAQKRKEQRYSVINSPLQSSMAKNNKILFDGVWRDCLMNDISFSGACVFIAGQRDIYPNQKIALQFRFSNPGKIFVLPAAVLRMKSVDSNIIEVAFKFMEPVDVLFIERLYEFVKLFH